MTFENLIEFYETQLKEKDEIIKKLKERASTQSSQNFLLTQAILYLCKRCYNPHCGGYFGKCLKDMNGN